MRQIPIQNMYYILCYAWGMGEMRGKVNVGVERCDSIANLLVHVLLNATDDLAWVIAGLYGLWSRNGRYQGQNQYWRDAETWQV